MKVRSAERITKREAWLNAVAGDRGDVPGWVLITLMTAGLVVAIWASAGPALDKIMDDSFARVAGF
jgi:hypothetical protein